MSLGLYFKKKIPASEWRVDLREESGGRETSLRKKKKKSPVEKERQSELCSEDYRKRWIVEIFER